MPLLAITGTTNLEPHHLIRVIVHMKIRSADISSSTEQHGLLLDDSNTIISPLSGILFSTQLYLINIALYQASWHSYGLNKTRTVVFVDIAWVWQWLEATEFTIVVFIVQDTMWWYITLDNLNPEQNGWHIAENISKMHFIERNMLYFD